MSYLPEGGAYKEESRRGEPKLRTFPLFMEVADFQVLV